MKIVEETREVYVRLFGELAAGGRGRVTGDVVSGSKDVKRIPIRADVSDLIQQFERSVAHLVGWASWTMGKPICYRPQRREPAEPSPKTLAELADLDRLLPVSPEGIWSEANDLLDPLISRAKARLGDTAPAGLATPCPECSQPTIFRVVSTDGVLIVCCNPACDVDGDRRVWTEGEWLASGRVVVHSG